MLIRRIVESISFSDVMKVLSGAIAAIIFFLSPLKDSVLFWIWGEKFTYEIGNDNILDPDKMFYPEITVKPSSANGISGGVIIWEVKKSGELVNRYSEKFESFHEPRVFRMQNPLIATESYDNLDVSVSLETKYNSFDIDDFNYAFERSEARNTVGKGNFTGTWTVQFIDQQPVGRLIISENAQREFKGDLYIPEGVAGVSKIAISGRRDGQSIWLDDPSGGGVGVFFSEGKYGFEGEVASWTGKMIICNPCEQGGVREILSSNVWIFAKYYD